MKLIEYSFWAKIFIIRERNVLRFDFSNNTKLFNFIENSLPTYDKASVEITISNNGNIVNIICWPDDIYKFFQKHSFDLITHPFVCYKPYREFLSRLV